MSKESYIFDGVEFQVGDIIECLNIPFPEHAERYHIVLEGGETRDLGNNNIDMWQFWIPLKNIGHYSKNLDIFSKEDRDFYFSEED